MSLYLNCFNLHTLRMVRSARPTVTSTNNASPPCLCFIQIVAVIFKARVKLFGNNCCTCYSIQLQHPHQQRSRASAAFTSAWKYLFSVSRGRNNPTDFYFFFATVLGKRHIWLCIKDILVSIFIFYSRESDTKLYLLQCCCNTCVWDVMRV